MKDNYKIICAKDGLKEYANVCLVEDDNDDVRLKFDFDELSTEIQADNFFDALIILRKELELKGYKLLCKGCCKNVYPSAMMLSMGAGRKAYVLTKGEQAKMSNVVDIFEPCDISEYASVEEQQDFFEQWINSLGD